MPVPFFKDEDAERIEALLDQGLSFRRVALEFGCHHETVRDFVCRKLPERYERRIQEQYMKPAAKLLVVDIETMANLAWVWGVWQQNIGPHQIVKHKRTISFAAKWVGEKQTVFYSEFHNGREAMVRAAWELFNQADAIIGYNSKRFDAKHLNTEFRLLGLGPPTHYQHIDLLQITKREFAFGSNKLESVADRLGLGKKREHEGFALWLKCEAGDENAWRRMRAYNRQDVALTESLFLEYREWIPLRGVQSQKRLREVLGEVAA